MMCKVRTLTLLGGEHPARPHETQDVLAGDQNQRKARSHKTVVRRPAHPLAATADRSLGDARDFYLDRVFKTWWPYR